MQAGTLSFDIAADLDAARDAVAGWRPDGGDLPSLDDHLYARWYQDGRADGQIEIWPQMTHYVAATAPFMQVQDGWRLERVDQGQLALRHDDGRHVAASWQSVAPLSPLLPLRPGAHVRRLAPLNARIDGFWHLWSDRWQTCAPDAVSRLYLPLEHGAEGDAARVLVANAPADRLWAAKFLCGPHPAGRRDPALIYLSAGDEGQDWVMALLDRMAPLFSAGRVRLARLWHGAWLAADPGDGRSFGQAVCEVLAALPVEARDTPERFRAEAMAALRPLVPHLEGV